MHESIDMPTKNNMKDKIVCVEKLRFSILFIALKLHPRQPATKVYQHTHYHCRDNHEPSS